MVSTVLVAAGIVASYAAYSYFTSLRRNILAARRSGLPYFVYPIHPYNYFWQLTSWVWVPLIKLLLPKSWWEKRLLLMLLDWTYNTNQEFYEWVGSETVILVSPYDMTLFTEHAELANQIMLKREAFPKDIARYGALQVFGENVVTTEGSLWRTHRKVTSASFNEKNAAHTFSESIRQAQGMLWYYFDSHSENSTSTKTITTLENDVITLTLNIISYVGFGLRLVWPGQKPTEDPRIAKYASVNPPPGYTMRFAQSLNGLLDGIIPLVMFSDTLLRILPFDFTKRAYLSKTNYYQYMDEFLRDKIDEVRRGDREREGMDIMGQLVRSTYGEKESKSGAKLADDEIISNAFLMILAGHETSANIFHFSLIELANNPAAQRAMQRDIDAIFKGASPQTWDYDKAVNPLLASYVGAVINETMRTMPPVAVIPKIVSAGADQPAVIDGKTHILPAGMNIGITLPAMQRNPRWWPTQPSKRTGKANDLEDWLPERWYRASKGDSEGGADGEGDGDGEDYGGFQGSDTSAALYRPVRGSYVPFSDGPRSCLGRRIAVVELIAVFAVLFQNHSIELAVDEWATDDEVARMSPAERRAVYAKAQDKSRHILTQASSIITLKLHGDAHVPVRFVQRGHERFVQDVELS